MAEISEDTKLIVKYLIAIGTTLEKILATLDAIEKRG